MPVLAGRLGLHSLGLQGSKSMCKLRNSTDCFTKIVGIQIVEIVNDTADSFKHRNEQKMYYFGRLEYLTEEF